MSAQASSLGAGPLDIALATEAYEAAALRLILGALRALEASRALAPATREALLAALTSPRARS